MKSKLMNLNVMKCLLTLCFVLLSITIVSAQSPDKRSWKQRLDKQKKEQTVCGTELLLKEMGIKQKGDALLCVTSNQQLTLAEVNSRFADRTASLIISATDDACLEVKKEQLTYVTRLNEVVRNVACPAVGTTTSKVLAATAAKEQLRAIDAWCANQQDAEGDIQLHYQLLQRIATTF